MPSPFTPGIGYAVEDEVGELYAASHPGELPPLVTYGKWARVGLNIRLKPDILNHIRKTYLEVKPLSMSGVGRAIVSMTIYDNSFGSLGYRPEFEWMPPRSIIYVQNTEFFIFNVAGVIFYTDSNIEELRREVSAVALLTACYGLVRLATTIGSALTEEGIVGKLAGYATRVGQLQLETEVELSEATGGWL
jgi:hypothetical protein